MAKKKAERGARYTPFRTLPQEPQEGPRLEKPRKIRRISRSPRRILADTWSRAISAVDAHARGCQACNRRRHDPGLQVTMGALLDPHLEPYRPCRKARALDEEERTARKAYTEAGYSLPVLPGLKALFLLIAPTALFWASAAQGVLA